MDFKDYYEILGISTNKVTFEEIKLAYRNQAKKYHPDLNIENVDEKIKDINEAYNVLSKPESKKKYDRLWRGYIGKTKLENKTYEHVGRTGNLADEFFEILLGKGMYKKLKKKSVKESKESNNIGVDDKLNTFINMKVSIEEAYEGTTKRIINDDSEIEVIIPKRSKAGDLIRIKGEGKKSESKERGDLIISLDFEKESNSKYEVNGIDIIANVDVYPSEAVIGAKVEKEILGKTMSVIIPPRVKQGKGIVIKNKGFKSKTGKMGSLIIKINIITPNSLTERQEELYKELYDIEKFLKH